MEQSVTAHCALIRSSLSVCPIRCSLMCAPSALLLWSSAIYSPRTAYAVWHHTTHSTVGATPETRRAVTVAITRARSGPGSWGHSSLPISKYTAPPPRDASKRCSGSPASASTSATLGWGMSQRSSMLIHHINRAAVSPRPGALQNSYALLRRLVSSERPLPSDPHCPLPSIHYCIFWLCRSIQSHR